MLHNHPVLFVSWRSPRTRSIHPVGRLASDAASHQYEFQYVRSVHKAIEDGFTAFPEFPKLDAVYRAVELFPLFANRVMPVSRPGYPSFLEALGLSPDTANPMTILARTGGRRETDQVELFPLPALDTDGCYVTHCLLRSLRYMPRPATEERVAKLVPGEQMYLMPDPQNPVDPRAVAVRTTDNFMIGYIPSYLTTDLRLLKDDCRDLKLYVGRINPPPAEAHHRLLCRVVSCWPPGFRPFDTDAFQPITSRPQSGVNLLPN